MIVHLCRPDCGLIFITFEDFLCKITRKRKIWPVRSANPTVENGRWYSHAGRPSFGARIVYRNYDRRSGWGCDLARGRRSVGVGLGNQVRFGVWKFSKVKWDSKNRIKYKGREQRWDRAEWRIGIFFTVEILVELTMSFLQIKHGRLMSLWQFRF